MKKVFLFISILLFAFCNTAAQEAAYEFVVHVIDNNENYYIEAELDLVSLCWNAVLNDYDDHDLTVDFPGSIISTDEENEPLSWNICWRSAPYDDDAFALGKYKLTVETEVSPSTTYSDYCYFDYRTSDLPEAYTSSADINIYLNLDNGQLYWDDDFTEPLGTSYTIWGLNPSIDLITTELEPYPPDNFALDDDGDYPYLTWSLSSEADYWTNFAIYRSVVSSGNPPGTFTKIATLSKYTTNYTDDDYTCGGPLTAYYKMTAVNGDRESDFTSTLNTRVGLYKGKNSKIELTNELNQNYPNPFNPTTVIKYTIEKPGFVNLTVYDILGNTIAILVNDKQLQGSHNIEFNAKNIPSGIYLYVIKTNDFQSSKKLLVIK